MVKRDKMTTKHCLVKQREIAACYHLPILAFCSDNVMNSEQVRLKHGTFS